MDLQKLVLNHPTWLNNQGFLNTSFLDTFWAIPGPESVHQPVQISVSTNPHTFSYALLYPMVYLQPLLQRCINAGLPTWT